MEAVRSMCVICMAWHVCICLNHESDNGKAEAEANSEAKCMHRKWYVIDTALLIAQKWADEGEKVRRYSARIKWLEIEIMLNVNDQQKRTVSLLAQHQMNA